MTQTSIFHFFLVTIPFSYQLGTAILNIVINFAVILMFQFFQDVIKKNKNNIVIQSSVKPKLSTIQ